MSDSDLPVPAWRPPPKRTTPARPSLSRDQIVDAGLRIVRSEGIEAVSMRRVAAVFDTGPSSLYAHVHNKDELLQLMFERICGEVEVPPPDPSRWQEQVKQIARNGHRVMCSYRDLAQAALATIPTGPNALKVSEGMLALMVAGGVPPRQAGWALDRLFLYMVADAYEGALYADRIGITPEEQRAYFGTMTEQLVEYYEKLPTDRFPYLNKYARDLVGGDGDERFEFGLDMLIDGIARHAGQ